MPENKDSPILKEIGATGTSLWGSYIVMEDEISDFQYLNATLDNYDKMRRDATVQAALSAIEYPIRALPYDVVSASESDEDKQIADFVKKDLFQKQSVTFDDYLRESLSCLWAGFSAFEKVWIKENGKIHLKKIATRLQSTCDGWEFDDEGGPKGMYQLAPPKYEREFIPISKMVLFSFAKEGGNIQGRSILRPGWRHFKFKDFLYKLQAVRAERDAVGVPFTQLPESATSADAQKAQDLVTSLRMDEEGGFVYPFNWTVGLLSGQGASFDIQSAIDHHDLMIAKSVQASFLNLAGMSVGSFALSKELTNLFLVSCNAVVKFICETNNRYFIQQWVDFNWGKREKYPLLYARPLEVRDLESAARALSLLVGSALLIPDSEVLSWIRSFFYGLPPVPETPASIEKPIEEEPEGELTLAEDKNLPLSDWSDEFLVSVGDLLKEWLEVEKEKEITVELQWKHLPPDRMFREVTLPGLMKELDKIQKLYEEGKISAKSLRIRSGNQLKKYGTASYAYGKALSTGVPQIDEKGRAIILPEEKPIINRYVALHRGYLANFQHDLDKAKREGKTLSLSSRVEQYALSAKNMFEAGRAAGMGFSPDLLPQIPGDMKTACGCRCDCTLGYEFVEGGVNVTWNLGTVVKHCSDCLRLASTWAPLFVPLTLELRSWGKTDGISAI